MSVITPAPVPQASDNNFFKEIEQLQNNFKKEDKKILVDTNQKFTKRKLKESKSEHFEK